MPLSTKAKVLSVVAAVSITIFAFHRGSSVDAASDSSDAQTASSETPVIDPTWGTRLPRECPLILSRPTNAQARVLLQCTMEYQMRGSIEFMQEVAVSVGATHQFDVRHDSFANDQDISKPMYAIHGTALGVSCTSLNSCTSNPWVNASGYCYALRGNKGYRCNFAGIPDRSQYKVDVPKPQTF